MNETPPVTVERGWFSRLVHAKLLAPLRASKHPPEYTARGVFFGLLVAMTPTVGIQMPIVFALWVVIRKLAPSRDFNLVVALAWTWVTNVITAPFLYYLYIVTGRILLGRWEDMQGFDVFRERLAETLPKEAGWLEAAWSYAVNLFDIFGIPMFVGCAPWLVLGSWAGYVWSLGLVRRIALARARRAAERASKESRS